MNYLRGVGQGQNPNWAQNAGPWPNNQPNGFDNFQPPAMDRTQPHVTHDRRSFTSHLSESQPGHFPDLSKFARCDRDGVLLEGNDAQNARSAGLSPGDIIRIRDMDENSRLHNRVMLVIRTNKSGSSYSVTCLSFCRHSMRRTVATDFTDEHARVVCAHSVQIGPDDNFPHLKIYIGTDDSGFKPQPEVWLNIREIWNVDLELAVAVLGEAEPQSFAALLEKVKEIFCNTIGDHRPIENPQCGEPQSQQQHDIAVGSPPEDNGGRSERRTKEYWQRRGLFGPTVKVTVESERGARHRQSG